MGAIDIKSAGKIYPNGTRALEDVNITINDGEFVVLVGPSGCGKTTLLRMVAGLEDITEGEISIGDKTVNDVAPKDRDIAMVFQNYALYPHMSVRQNMSYGLKIRRINKQEIDRRVNQAAEILSIEEYLDRKPRQLSGGQRQRVAMGRAIVRDPQVFLFDEPLSNLDAKLRVQMRLEIRKLQQRLKVTSIYVTHDQVEAMTLADKIVVLNGGHIEQVGSPITLYEAPQNKFVAQFIGSPKMNFFNSTDLNSSAPAAVKKKIDEKAELGIRPEHLMPCPKTSAMISAQMELVEQLGEYVLVHLKTAAGTELIAKLPELPKASEGEWMHFKAEEKFCHLFDIKTGIRRLK